MVRQSFIVYSFDDKTNFINSPDSNDSGIQADVRLQQNKSPASAASNIEPSSTSSNEGESAEGKTPEVG